MHEYSQHTLTLKSGYEMPVLGLGTWQLTGNTCEQIVRQAVGMGYRHIDTAELYENESEIGRALKDTDRETLFITSKVPSQHADRNGVLKACDRSLRKLQMEYLDLYLLHWPNDHIPIEQTLEALQHLVDTQKVRSIGLSNFNVDRLKEALAVSDVMICNLQIEYHPFTPRRRLPDFCTEQQITITAYSPLARGKVFDDEILRQIAEIHDKSPAQVSLRWLIQKGHIVIPKSSSREHLQSNLQIFDWELSPEDMEQINSIQHSQRLVDTQFT